MITDGEPTNDDFAITGTGNSNTTGRTVGFSDFKPSLIGDYNADGEVEEPAGSDGWLYLDDIAKFMQTHDFRPDLTGAQTIDVYTVGFATGLGRERAAREDGARSATACSSPAPRRRSSPTRWWTRSSRSSSKSQSFTAATVPATRTSFGGKFYNSLFVPADDSGYWEGHLQSWTITEAGEILDDNGNCAFDGNPVPCLEGTLQPDRGPALGRRRRRAGAGQPHPLHVEVVSGTPTRVAFSEANIDETDLTLAAGDAVALHLHAAGNGLDHARRSSPT